MPLCRVIGCNNDWRKTNGISFHKFPKNEKTRKIWMKRLSLPPDFFPTPSSVICSDHFHPGDIDNSMSRMCLYQDALPIDSRTKDTNSPIVTSDESQEALKDQEVKDNPAQSITLENNQIKTGEKSSSYLLVTVPCGKSLKNETPIKRKLRLEIIYNKEIVQIKSRIITNLHRQNIKLRERIRRMKILLKEIENRRINDGGICYSS